MAQQKVYLLEPAVQEAVRAAREGMRAQAAPKLEEVPEAWVKTTVVPARRPFKGVPALVAAYTLGGVAPLALRSGPRKFAWAVLSALSLTGWVALVWYWPTVRAAMESARLPILPSLLALAVVHVIGALAWSRGISVVVRDTRFQPQALPRGMRAPWLAAVLGLFLPGFGLAMAGCGRRAGLALWNAASVVMAALVLAFSHLLWTWNAKSGTDALPKMFVEALFIAMAVVFVFGSLGWIGTALDGARLVEQGRASFRRARIRTTSVRADAAAIGLVTVLALFAVTFQPAKTAHDLDQFASAMRFDGYRIIPLALQSAAASLDPGRPEYQMRVAELHVEMGHPETARAIENRLRERWEVYAQMLLQTAAATRTTAPSRPIEPARDLVPRSQELAPSLVADPPASPAQ
jgi:hypothetical protein